MSSGNLSLFTFSCVPSLCSANSLTSSNKDLEVLETPKSGHPCIALYAWKFKPLSQDFDEFQESFLLSFIECENQKKTLNFGSKKFSLTQKEI